MSLQTWLQSRISSAFGMLRQGVVHFPLAWGYALIATVLLLIGVHFDLWEQERYWIYAGIMGATFGLLVAIAHGILQQDRVRPAIQRTAFLLALASGPLFGWWVYSWMGKDAAPESIWIQAVACYCLAGILLYLAHFRVWGKERELADWGVLLAYAGGVSYVMAGILSAGISLTLLSIDKLFDVQIDDDLYAYVWTVAGFFFGISYFLGMMVEKSAATISVPAHSLFPRLVQWVLRPLLTVYFLVMLAYSIKIAVSQEFPRGVISGMVIGYGLTGFLAILQTAWMNATDSRPLWTRLFAYSFPLPVVLLFIAVVRRVVDYGWTESRILLLLGILVIAVGICGIAWKGAKALLVVALALLLVSLGFALGPFGWSALAKQSQLGRLQQMVLAKADELQKGDLVRHMERRYGRDCMRSILDSVELAKYARIDQTEKSIYWSAEADSSFSVEGMERCKVFHAGAWGERANNPAIMRIEQKRYLSGAPHGLLIRQDLLPLADSLYALEQKNSIRGPRISLQGTSDSIHWRIALQNASFVQRSGGREVISMDGLLCWE